MLERLHNNRKYLMIPMDAFLVAISWYFTLVLRFEFGAIPPQFIHGFFVSFPINIAITIGVFYAFRLYHCIWSYYSLKDVFQLVIGCSVIIIIEIVYMQIFSIPMPRSCYPISMMFFAMFAVWERLCIRVIKRRRSETISNENQKAKARTMIVGAGAAGYMLINELSTNPSSGNNVVCVVDDNKSKIGRYIQGIKIAGNRHAIPRLIVDYKIEEIIVAIPSLCATSKGKLLNICNSTGCRVKVLPEIATTFTGSISSSVRDISIHDLVGREQVKVNEEGINAFVKDKVVLVTGGGGSIGSELCRQLMERRPKLLIIFDVYENNAYSIQMELEAKYGNEHIRTIIGSVRDYDRLESIFKEYRPELVYHAAAHKHVPLMEVSPCEAVKNNCLGTYNTAKLAHKYKVTNFVLISTDKAVRPTSVMGATKRICEMIIQSYSQKSETKFAAVRFGNVLGSNGSVVPLFMRQIEKGGPVTVTHREITRFFMSIPEAVSLVLQTSLYAGGGEIFVLDMGEPVNIYDLAENLIRLQGYVPNKDIQIEIIGLRPGEKLYEEILMDEEGLRKTESDLIFIGNQIEFDMDNFRCNLKRLIDMALKNSENIKEEIERVCNTYSITDNESDNRVSMA